MPWRDAGLHALGLAVHPGLLFSLLAGCVLEIGAGWALVPERGGPSAAARSVLRGLRLRSAGPPPGGPCAAALLCAMAAVQTSLPLNPVPASERNLLTAGVGGAAGSWAVWAWAFGRGGADSSLALRVQLCWCIALLAPAVAPVTLRPQGVGVLTVAPLLPVKVLAAILYLACLPVLLQLLPESAPQGIPSGPGATAGGRVAGAFRGVRLLLWVPCCGLFASLFVPGPADDPGSAARYAGAALGAAAVAIVLAANLVRRPPAVTLRFYSYGVVPLAAVTFAVMLASSLATGGL